PTMGIFIPIALEISIHFIPESGIHIPGIDIHIKSERLFTSSGICNRDNCGNMSVMKNEDDLKKNSREDEEVRDLMKAHDLDHETAARVRDMMDEYGIDEDDALER